MSQARVFISYRRSDTGHVAGRLRDLIVARFGEESVFVDVESILPGEDYVTAIDTAVSSCMAMCVLIGESWLATDTEGVRRIDDPADWLRLEVEAGLRHRTVVIPVLVDAATLPKTRDLPEPLVALASHQAVRLRHDSFHSDCQRVLEVIDRIADEPGATRRRHVDGHVDGPADGPFEQRPCAAGHRGRGTPCRSMVLRGSAAAHVALPARAARGCRPGSPGWSPASPAHRLTCCWRRPEPASGCLCALLSVRAGQRRSIRRPGAVRAQL